MMTSVNCGACGKAYSLKPETAGQTFVCQLCNNQITIPVKNDECNITLSFVCDRSWENLTTTDGEHRFCDGCQQNVYWVSSDQEGQDHARLGHCIAYPDQGRVLLGEMEPPRKAPPIPTLMPPESPPKGLFSDDEEA